MIRVTTLIENSMGEHLALKNEHGQSFCIETPEHTILFDTGQSDQFIHNAKRLRIDLSKIEFVVLSHGHYDHSGGLLDLVALTKQFELVVGKGFFLEKYAALNGGGYEFLGNNFTPEDLSRRALRFSELTEPLRELVPGVYVLGRFPRLHKDEVINSRFKILKDGAFVDDPFDDEVMVVVDTPRGLIAILGCSHPGMKNMLDAVRSRFKKDIYAVLGGTHLVEASPESMKASIEYLEQGNFQSIGVSHCTGQKAMNQLSISEKRYFHNRTGSSLMVF